MAFTYEWRGAFDNAALNALHAEGFDHRVLDGAQVGAMFADILTWLVPASAWAWVTSSKKVAWVRVAPSVPPSAFGSFLSLHATRDPPATSRSAVTAVSCFRR